MAATPVVRSGAWSASPSGATTTTKWPVLYSRNGTGPHRRGHTMRHVLGVLGILAAGVLLAVSAAMNWRFGFSLGRTELDGEIYGAASAAADCMKALVPFFFFAAVRNRVWSQAAASALVWVVVTAYSMTSALGHAALNRFDSTGQRAQEAQSYQDLRGELKRARGAGRMDPSASSIRRGAEPDRRHENAEGLAMVGRL